MVLCHLELIRMQKHNELWQSATKNLTQYPRLESDIKVDVAIVGAGITGITASLKLTAAGLKVGIFEAHRFSQSTTSHSTANLYIPVQPSYYFLKKGWGAETVKRVIESRCLAIDFIENMVSDWQIDCNFIRRPLYLFATDKKKNKYIEREMEVIKAAGLPIHEIADLPVPFSYTKAAVLENQARFNPLQYLQSLLNQLTKQECELFEHTPIVNIEEQAEQVTLYTEQHKIIAQQVIMATHIPKGIHQTHFLVYPYRSYAVAVRLKNENYVNGNFWHLDFPFFATSTHNVFHQQIDLMIIAGHSHKIGHPKEDSHLEHFAKTEQYARQHWDVASTEYRWSAQHYQSADGLPYIGLSSKKSKRIYIGTGYFADGLVYGTVAGLLIADLIMQKPNPFASIYSPQRFKPFVSSFRFIKENTVVFFDFVKDYLLNFIRAKKIETINKGEGKIIKFKSQFYAVYRDIDNTIYAVSAICTHMYCLVRWNDAEKTWDCPCHGSRFTPQGEIIEGPALKPLAQCPQLCNTKSTYGANKS